MPPNNTRLLLLRLETLEKRRGVSQVSYIAGLMLGTIDAPPLLHKLRFCVPRLASRQPRILNESRHNTQYAVNAPMSIMTRKFNEHAELFDYHPIAKKGLVEPSRRTGSFSIQNKQYLK